MNTVTFTPALALRRPLSLLREPLLHFVLLGGLLFAADHALVSRNDDPHTIIMGSDVDKELTDLFVSSRNRSPTPQEMRGLQQAWVDNEVLYREGMALAVEKGDQTIRDRVIFKTQGVIETGVKLQAPDDKVLKSWFEQRRSRYDEPARISFEEAALAGSNDEAEVRSFVKDLRSGTPGDAKAGLRVFKNLPATTIDQSYGADFTKQLTALPAGEWNALATRDGWRAIRLTAVLAPVPADFESRRADILQDWKDETASDQRTAAVRALARKYRILHEDAKR